MSQNDSKSIGDAEDENLAKSWSNLSRFEQGQHVKDLLANGHSMRGLAEKIGVSEATIRKRVDLANLSSAEREAVESGKASVKGTLRKIRQKRAAAAPRVPTEPEARKTFVEARAQLTLHWIAEAIPMDEQAIAKLPESARWSAREGILRYRIEVLENMRERPFFELAVFGKPLQNRRVRLSRADPCKVIKRCKPKGEMGSTVPDHVNFWMKWFQNWASRLMPDWTVRYAVLNWAIHLLGNEIQKPSHGSELGNTIIEKLDSVS